MTLEELQNATEDQLRQLAIERFDGYTQSRNPSRVELLWEAQFFMREMEHRETERERNKERRRDKLIGWRDLILELVVIGLIGWEIHLAIQQGKDEDVLMGKQNSILTNLQNSTSDTATTMKGLAEITKALSESSSASAKTLLSLRATTETMNKGVHDQLDLFYDPSLELDFDVTTKRLLLHNTGRTSITVTRLDVRNEDVKLDSPRMVAALSEHYFDLTPLYTTLSNTLPKGSSELVPVKIYVENEQRKQFVLDANLLCVWDKDNIAVYTHVAPLTRKQ